jgi:fructose-1,6-bisphosphatase/sedoheptulose 1,7-bisphosphatase-like protein
MVKESQWLGAHCEGVTEGALLKGVRFFAEGTRTSSVILTLKTGRVWFIESIHLDKGPDVRVRFA